MPSFNEFQAKLFTMRPVGPPPSPAQGDKPAPPAPAADRARRRARWTSRA
ncbi:hypothetical protein [Olsenella massiliensis]|nr:hypothetical protein [Olsenella massiliensis]